MKVQVDIDKEKKEREFRSEKDMAETSLMKLSLNAFSEVVRL